MRFRTRGILAVLAVVPVLALAACSDDPLGSAEHPVPSQVQVRAAGLNFANATTFSAFGTVLAPVAGESEIQVVFLDEMGIDMTLASDQFLEVLVENEAVALWEPDAAGSFTGKIQGVAAGSTKIQFRLMHGKIGSTTAHSDFTSAKIDLVVS
jgi:bacillopeptidase F (M6 metalloprotease family)